MTGDCFPVVELDDPIWLDNVEDYCFVTDNLAIRHATTLELWTGAPLRLDPCAFYSYRAYAFGVFGMRFRFVGMPFYQDNPWYTEFHVESWEHYNVKVYDLRPWDEVIEYE